MHEMPAVFSIHFLVLYPIQCDTQFEKDGSSHVTGTMIV